MRTLPLVLAAGIIAVGTAEAGTAEAGTAEAGTAEAGDDAQAAARKLLAPRPVEFSKTAMPLQDALAELARGTGNRIADPRREQTNPIVALPAGRTRFWPALDAIGLASGIGFSSYLPDGGVGLTEAPYRRVPIAYTDLFRVAVRRVAVVRDEETQLHHTQLGFDIAWEPRFQPFYVDLKQLKVTFAPDANKKSLVDVVPARGPAHVAGRGGISLDVLTAAPARSSPAIASLEGTLWAVGPSKMLDFDFAKLALLKPGQKPSPQSVVQEDVTVTLASIRRLGDALVVKVRIENPKGTPSFESHQSWWDNNRIALVHADRKRSFVGVRSGDRALERWAEIEYEFAESAGPLPASLDGWTLRCTTPGRIVELTAPFALEKLPLP
jgi:hypothetical protein